MIDMCDGMSPFVHWFLLKWLSLGFLLSVWLGFVILRFWLPSEEVSGLFLVVCKQLCLSVSLSFYQPMSESYARMLALCYCFPQFLIVMGQCYNVDGSQTVTPVASIPCKNILNYN